MYTAFDKTLRLFQTGSGHPTPSRTARPRWRAEVGGACAWIGPGATFSLAPTSVATADARGLPFPSTHPASSVSWAALARRRPWPPLEPVASTGNTSPISSTSAREHDGDVVARAGRDRPRRSRFRLLVRGHEASAHGDQIAARVSVPRADEAARLVHRGRPTPRRRRAMVAAPLRPLTSRASAGSAAGKARVVSRPGASLATETRASRGARLPTTDRRDGLSMATQPLVTCATARSTPTRRSRLRRGHLDMCPLQLVHARRGARRADAAGALLPRAGVPRCQPRPPSGRACPVNLSAPVLLDQHTLVDV